MSFNNVTRDTSRLNAQELTKAKSLGVFGKRCCSSTALVAQLPAQIMNSVLGPLPPDIDMNQGASGL